MSVNSDKMARKKNEFITADQFKPTILHGQNVTLKPLSHEHHNDLVEASNDGKLWQIWYAFELYSDLVYDSLKQVAYPVGSSART